MGCCECESNLCITIHWDLPDSVIWLSESSLSFDSPLHASPPPITQAVKHGHIAVKISATPPLPYIVQNG